MYVHKKIVLSSFFYPSIGHGLDWEFIPHCNDDLNKINEQRNLIMLAYTANLPKFGGIFGLKCTSPLKRLLESWYDFINGDFA